MPKCAAAGAAQPGPPQRGLPCAWVWSAVACCRFLPGGTAYQAVVGGNLPPTRFGERTRSRVLPTAPRRRLV